jgi:hypothetical protein
VIPYPLVEFSATVGTWEVVDYAYPDTGFDGGLIIPQGVGWEILAEPEITWLRMPDGERREVSSWDGSVILDGRPFRTEVTAFGPGYLIGRDILDQLEICFEFGEELRVRFERD